MFLGIEIGGTKLQVGVCDGQGKLRRLTRVAVVRQDGARGICRQLTEIVPPMLRANRVTAIGVGFGGPVDAARGRVVKSHQITGWDNFALRRWCERIYELPTVVENDANLAALAEALLGAGCGKRAVFYITVGTGIGGGFVVDGELYNGRLGAAEIGHTRLDLGASERSPTLESVAAGLAIERGVSTVAKSARHLGVAVANMIALLNPDVVVIGGGVALAGEKFFGPLRATVRRLVFAPFRGNHRLVPAALGETVVVVGAALLAKQSATRTKGSRQKRRE